MHQDFFLEADCCPLTSSIPERSSDERVDRKGPDEPAQEQPPDLPMPPRVRMRFSLLAIFNG